MRQVAFTAHKLFAPFPRLYLFPKAKTATRILVQVATPIGTPLVSFIDGHVVLPSLVRPTCLLPTQPIETHHSLPLVCFRIIPALRLPPRNQICRGRPRLPQPRFCFQLNSFPWPDLFVLGCPSRKTIYPNPTNDGILPFHWPRRFVYPGMHSPSHDLCVLRPVLRPFSDLIDWPFSFPSSPLASFSTRNS